LEPSWRAALSAELEKDYFAALQEFVAAQFAKCKPGAQVLPPAELVFQAFYACPLNQVRVCIIGQDPYHKAGQAMGLCFSVPRGVAVPPSLRVIYKELLQDLGISAPSHGDLSSWSHQGVLMLNTSLTVRESAAGSHAKKFGWESFTNSAIEAVSCHCRGVVFMLWGKHAQAKAKLVDATKHHVLTAAHPSPLAGASGNFFVGCRHFSRANHLLVQQGKPAVDWQVL